MFHSLPQPVPNAVQGNTFRLVVAYDGTDFCGWQIQPGRQTIQGSLQNAILQVTGEPVLPQGSGRTDTGVHAEGQTVSLLLKANIPADRLQRAINRKLPSAIRVLSAELAAPTFHARACVLNKTYEYRVFLRRLPGSLDESICQPAQARYAWDCRWPLRLDLLQDAARMLVGTHDFTSFAATDPDRTRRILAHEGQNNIRTVYRSEWQQQERTLTYRVTGSGFLHHMVRNMVGTCVLAGAGRLDPAAIPQILAGRNRSLAGPTAPPQGLHLMQVVYAEDGSSLPEPAPELVSA